MFTWLSLSIYLVLSLYMFLPASSLSPSLRTILTPRRGACRLGLVVWHVQIPLSDLSRLSLLHFFRIISELGFASRGFYSVAFRAGDGSHLPGFSRRRLPEALLDVCLACDSARKIPPPLRLQRFSRSLLAKEVVGRRWGKPGASQLGKHS